MRNAFLGPLVSFTGTKDGGTLLFLPLAHVYARVIQVGCIDAGVVLGHCGDINQLLPALGAFRPTFILAVPRVFEKVYNGAEQKAASDRKGAIFGRAARTAIAYSQALDSAGGPGLSLRAQHALFDRLVYAKLRAALGGRASYAISGGAALTERLCHFFRGVGVTVLQGYGLTETTASSTVNRPERNKIGTVGQPLPGVAIKISAESEILIRGGNVFPGYWQEDEATKEAFTEDGWFRTGDLGALDDEGFLTITGRQKEILVTAGGKNVAPAVLEDRLRSHALIGQAMVVGDGRPYIAALITLDPDALGPWKSRARQGRRRDARLAARRPRPAGRRPGCGGRREPGRLAGRVDQALPHPRRRIHRRGGPAQRQAGAAQGGAGQGAGRRHRPGVRLSDRWPPGRPRPANPASRPKSGAGTRSG